MMPAGFAGVEDQLWLWLVAMIRPGAAFLAAPIFGAAFVPIQVRAIVALAIGIPGLALTSFHLPPEGLATMAGFLLVACEIIAGCFPGREIIPIDCYHLIWGLGTLHCISQQQPA